MQCCVNVDTDSLCGNQHRLCCVCSPQPAAPGNAAGAHATTTAVEQEQEQAAEGVIMAATEELQLRHDHLDEGQQDVAGAADPAQEKQIGAGAEGQTAAIDQHAARHVKPA